MPIGFVDQSPWSVPRSSRPAALAAISAVAQQLFGDGFMQQPPCNPVPQSQATHAPSVPELG